MCLRRRRTQPWTTGFRQRCQGGGHGLAGGGRGHTTSVVAWNMMIAEHAREGRLEEAQRLFEAMPARSTASWNTMISGHARNGSLERARSAFDCMPRRDVVSWTAMIAAYAKSSCRKEEALRLFRRMGMEEGNAEPNAATLVVALGACSCSADGKFVHAAVAALLDFELHVIVGNALISMYGRCGSALTAHRVFRRMHRRDDVSWNALLAVSARHHPDVARHTLVNTPHPNATSLTTVISGYAHNNQLHKALQLFHQIPESERDVIVFNTIISALTRNGRLPDAEHLFAQMPIRDTASWNSLISGYTHHGQITKAIELFHQIHIEGVKPNLITFITILSACAGFADLNKGKFVHASIHLHTCEPDSVVVNALIYMYAKCGSLEDAKNIFDKMLRRDAVSWNSIIVAYALNGQGKDSLGLLRRMNLEGVKPNNVTLITVLSACSHAGLLNEAMYLFASMYKDYGVAPTVDHYVCMIDLLGRVGQLDEVEKLIRDIPFEPKFESFVVAWRCLLGACRKCGDKERATHVAEHLFELDPKDATPYVMLSNIYAMVGS